MNIQDSILAPYVSDPNDDGSYVLNLSHEDTMMLWEVVDGQSEELKRLRAGIRIVLQDRHSYIDKDGYRWINVPDNRPPIVKTAPPQIKAL